MIPVTSADDSLLSRCHSRKFSLSSFTRASPFRITYAFLLIGSLKPAGRTGPRDSFARLYPIAAAFLETIRLLFSAFRKRYLIIRHPCTQIKNARFLCLNEALLDRRRWELAEFLSWKLEILFLNSQVYIFIFSRAFLNTIILAFLLTIVFALSNGKYNLHFFFFFFLTAANV